MQNKFVYPLRIHIEDTDCSGVVYHSKYINFMERARSEWLEEQGLGVSWIKQQERQFLVHSVNIEFIKPARVHELVVVVTSVKEMRSASVVFAQHLHFTDMPDKILCKAEIKIVCVDFNLRPQAIPKTPFFEAIRRTLT